MHRLLEILDRIDGRGYKAYKELQGRRFKFPCFTLIVDHVQGDPYASPSRIRTRVDLDRLELPVPAARGPDAIRATRDFLVRSFHRRTCEDRYVAIDCGKQTVLDRSACLIFDSHAELRFTVELPARGRRILGRQARAVLCDLLPRAIDRALLPGHLDQQKLIRHINCVEDQVALRNALAARGLVAFVADEAVLPRRSGVDDRPLADSTIFRAPASLRVNLETPNSGPISGLGIPAGITLIVGGGFQGKSTLLRALEVGVFDHVPGDGRERVVTDSTAVKLRAEDGRSVNNVDISPFIGPLPDARPTDRFSTEFASGSTSQAAAVVEALECGSRVLLVDEDTSATNFMIRDRRMQLLVSRKDEPITPLLDRIRQLRDEHHVSTVIVMGGSGDYFDHADTVIQLDSFLPVDVSERAREVAQQYETGREAQHTGTLRFAPPRTLDPSSIKPERKPGRVKVGARDRDTLLVGRSTVDLRAVAQVVDSSQVRAIGWILAHLASHDREVSSPIDSVEQLLARLRDQDWDWLSGHPDGDFAAPRLHEVLAALNRLRGVRFRPEDQA